jgi:hypothetical protein
MLMGAKVYDADAGADENCDDDGAVDSAMPDGETERPISWIFPGWMAYCMFGPRAHADFQSALFEVGDWNKNKRSATGDSKDNGGRVEQ